MATKKLQKAHHNTSIANLHLFQADLSPDEGKSRDPLKESYRLRAHALHGLFGLLTRAAMDVVSDENISKDDKAARISAYEKLIITKYKVPEYIQNYILKDSWGYNVDKWSAINLDTWWTYVCNLDKPVYDVGSEKAEWFGINSKGYTALQDMKVDISKEEADAGLFSGLRYMYHSIVQDAEGIQKANFQQYFPIHYMSNMTVENFSTAYEGTYNA